MNKQQFWELVAEAREQAGKDSGATDAVARGVTLSLSGRPVEEILAAERALWELMAESCRTPLWAAAYLINGGCSDDGFDYFRGWLMAQGREIFEQVVREPDSLAELPVVQDCAAAGGFLEGEAMLAVAWDAHLRATGEEPPAGTFANRCPQPEDGWDFDDADEMARRLPRLAALCEE